MSPRTTQDDSFPDLGIIENYNAERGFGFVRSILEQENYFFHITQLGESLLKRQMISGQNTYRGVYLSYVVQKTDKGHKAFSLQVPSVMQGERLGSYIKRIRTGLRFRGYEYDPVELRVLLSLLVSSSETTDENLGELLCSSFSEHYLKDLIAVLIGVHSDSRLRGIRSTINFERFWCNTDSSVPLWLPPLTSVLCGEDELARLIDCRAASARERTQLQEAAKRECWEEIRTKIRTQFAEAAERYRRNPAGIRNDILLADFCLICADRNVERIYEGFGANRRCLTCGSHWYVNHCWNCMSAMVNSRDPETAPCCACRWLRCAKCDACTDSPSGCSRRLYANPASLS